MLEILQWFVNLGSTVFLPVIICIFALILGVKLSKAIMAGITVGLGFIGLNLVIGLLSSSLGTAIQLMGKKYGFSLSIMDIGCGVGGPLAFSTTLGILIIPISIILNFIFVMLGVTKTLNVDIWNFWFPAFIALAINALTGNFWMGIGAMVVSLMLQWLLADLFQEKISKFFNYPGIAITHMMALSGVVFAVPVNWLFDRIPGLNKIDADAESIQKKFGIFGDTIVIGLIIGIVIGVLAGYDFAKVVQLGMQTAAVMKIMPKMVAMFMEGLLPISESAKEFTDKKLHGRKVNIGMDAALTVGHPAVMSTYLLLVPISLLLAIALPGNQVLPFGDLAFYAFAICLMIPFFKGNIVRSILGSSIYMCTMLYLSTWLAPLITKVFELAKYDVGTSGIISSVNCGLWPVALFVIAVGKLGWIGILLIGLAVLGLLIYINKVRVNNNQVKINNDQVKIS
jgi:PTS system galactitol-specific IIC component